MSSYNRVTLMGNLTRQPELRKTKTGTAVTELGLALNRSWTAENGQRQDETTFVDVTVWGRAAENAAQYLQKGRAVLIEGRLQLDQWQDRESGQDRSKLKVVADSVQFLGSNAESAAPEREESRASERAERPRHPRSEERRNHPPSERSRPSEGRRREASARSYEKA